MLEDYPLFRASLYLSKNFLRLLPWGLPFPRLLESPFLISGLFHHSIIIIKKWRSKSGYKKFIKLELINIEIKKYCV